MRIVAECGCNFRNIKEAKEMIRQSKQAGASYSKFQLYSWTEIKDAPDIIREDLQKIMLTRDTAKELFDYGKQINQKVFFTPMYPEAVDICEEIGVELYKIRFGDCYNYDLIYKVLATHKEVLMSIDRDYRAMEFKHNRRIAFLYVVPEYPAQPKSYKLTPTIFEYFSGISDHTPNLELARKALKLNPDIIIEKHVKLDDNCIEKDWSVTFDDLKSLQESEDKK